MYFLILSIQVIFSTFFFEFLVFRSYLSLLKAYFIYFTLTYFNGCIKLFCPAMFFHYLYFLYTGSALHREPLLTHSIRMRIDTIVSHCTQTCPVRQPYYYVIPFIFTFEEISFFDAQFHFEPRD